jgi:hypothetical protein
MKFTKLALLISLSIGAGSAHASSRGKCERQLSEGGWSVTLSSKYNALTLTPLAACVAMTGGTCLGAVAAELMQSIGLDLAFVVFKNFGDYVTHNGKKIQAGVCAKRERSDLGIKFTDYYFYVRNKTNDDGPNPSDPDTDCGDYSPKLFASWGIYMDEAEHNHWVAHCVIAGKSKMTEDALRNIVRKHWLDWDIQISDNDANFWYYHLLNAGRGVWQEHQRKNVIQNLFSKCGVDIGTSGPELEHWYRHSLNVSKVVFMRDLVNGRTCRF